MTPRTLLFNIKRSEGSLLDSFQDQYKKAAETVPDDLKLYLDMQYLSRMTEEHIAETCGYSTRHMRRLLKAGKEAMLL